MTLALILVAAFQAAALAQAGLQARPGEEDDEEEYDYERRIRG